jgi:peroxiredoxin
MRVVFPLLHAGAAVRWAPHPNPFEEPQMTVALGSMAPDFTLKSSKMEDVTLSKLHGKPVLLLFFPLAFTPT